MKTRILLLLSVVLLALTAAGVQSPERVINITLRPDTQVITRGQDFAKCRVVTTNTDASGTSTIRSDEFTLLENCLHYFDDGSWKLSEDLIESFPDGAVARRGPNKTIFSSDLNSEAVFDIQTADGQRIRGGVRSIQLTDLASGKSVVLGTVKATLGVLVPPNQVLYQSGFDGLDADVLFVWRHNSISQNVILKKRPALPDGMNPATTRLEVVTELVESPVPALNTVTRKEAGKPDLRDDITMNFGSLQAMRGKAFPVTDGTALLLTGAHLTDDTSGTFVAKEFHRLPDGRKFIIESVSWSEAEPMMTRLAAAKKDDQFRQAAAARVWPKRLAAVAKKEPLQVAAAPHQANGFLVDLDLSGSASSYTFLSGTTYYIAQSFYIGGPMTVQPGSVIKYGNDAWLLVNGAISFPPAGQLMPVLTSKDDDLFGAMISGSTHTPTYMAAKALLVYYVQQYQTLIQNVRIRWAKRGIEYDAYVGVGTNHELRDSLFQKCQTGVYAEVPDGSMTLVNVKKCDVLTPITCNCDGQSGSLDEDCGPLYAVANFGGITQQESGGISPPDTMGAVGPSHFTVVLNSGVSVHNKYTGARVSPAVPTSLNTFFALTIPSGLYAGSYPNAPVDPRIVFDAESQRWIACCIDVAVGHVILAVSNSADPVGNGGADWVQSNWKKYLVPTGPCQTDYDILGVDSNGIYITVRVVGCESVFIRLSAVPKAPLVTPNQNPSPVQGFNVDLGIFGDVYPAVNLDPIAAGDPTWLIYSLGNHWYLNRLKWVNGFSSPPELQDNPWTEVVVDLSYEVSGGGVNPPQLGATNRLFPRNGGLMGAAVRTISGIQYLWTSRTVGVNKDGIYGPPVPYVKDRCAVEWAKIQTTPAVSLAAQGRIYDPNLTNFKFYYMPSVTVNKNGDMVMGFSGSSGTDYVGAYYFGILNNGGSPTQPIRYFSGKDWYGTTSVPASSWGDYSYTSLDPDGLTVWTIQEYAETRYRPLGNAWSTRICAITPF